MHHQIPRPPAGIYVHWPFCERKCPYCDFYTFGREHPFISRQADYLEALLAEIQSAPARLHWSAKPAADTIYFGGGTPSLMGPEAMARILAALDSIFDFSPSRGSTIETTLEVNPTSAEAAQIERMIALGVNRFSVGSQSFNDRILQRLGRVHDAATTRRALAHMRAAGASNLSLDLIFAAPTQSIAELNDDLDELIAFAPEHVSAYGMTIHKGTPFERWQSEGKLPLPDEDQYAAMYETIIDRLAAAGYEHYEISNWAKPGRQSRHNSKYWRDIDIAAFGVSAHGVWSGRRFENPRDLTQYSKGDPASLDRTLDPPAGDRARCGEAMMLALRRVDGAAWAEIDAWLSCDARAFYEEELNRLSARHLIETNENTIRLTREGLLLADTVMAEFF